MVALALKLVSWPGVGPPGKALLAVFPEALFRPFTIVALSVEPPRKPKPLVGAVRVIIPM